MKKCPLCRTWKGDKNSELCRACSIRFIAGCSEVFQNYILFLRLKGLFPKEIAFKTGKSLKALEYHFGRLYARAGTCNPMRLALWAIRKGIVETR